MNTTPTPTPTESTAAVNLAKALLEFILAISEANAQRERARPREQITVKVEQPPPPSPPLAQPKLPSQREPDESVNDMLTVKEAAAYLRMSDRTMWRLVGIGEVRVMRIGRSVRIRRRDLDSYIESGTARR